MDKRLIWKNLKFVTGNPNKVREAHEILGFEIEHAGMELHEIQTCSLREVVTAKAHQAWEALQVPVMVEDSGLIFSAWNGLPGALVKWFEKTVGCEGLLKMLSGFDNRQATAVCMVAVYDGSNLRIAEGRVAGNISAEPRGQNGFGWDIIFIPEGHTGTYAEMSAEEKNSISHRRRALEELKKLL